MKILILLWIFVVSFSFCSAQNNSFDIKKYSYELTDKYKPATAGTLAIIPGAGHFYSGHYGRGLLFPAGMAISTYLIVSGSLSEWAAQGSPDSGSSLVTVGLITFIGFYTWNFFDAVKVAKINNMHLRQQALSFQFEPYFVNRFESQLNSNVAGLSMKFTF